MTIKEYATTRNITYEAGRQAVIKAMPKLENHITKQGRIRILDDYAVKYLDDLRKGSRISVIRKESSDHRETVEELQKQIIFLQNRIIELQETATINAGSVARLEAMTDTNKRLQSEIDHLQSELQAFKPSLFGFYRKK